MSGPTRPDHMYIYTLYIFYSVLLSPKRTLKPPQQSSESLILPPIHLSLSLSLTEEPPAPIHHPWLLLHLFPCSPPLPSLLTASPPPTHRPRPPAHRHRLAVLSWQCWWTKDKLCGQRRTIAISERNTENVLENTDTPFDCYWSVQCIIQCTLDKHLWHVLLKLSQKEKTSYNELFLFISSNERDIRLFSRNLANNSKCSLNNLIEAPAFWELNI
ncbi:uncharacterized protein LOC131332645 [Rhododendron vialii]|uniref:uncharacterized protein LOC131332645 n=1 Tax=Rhododendron vialii TaxID=182163 RepID=UPI00265F3DB7|nr:uncharacterized protein LOC131332645 [Rhododendron vialii]